MTAEALRDCLLSAPPLELIGMRLVKRLLKAHPSPGLFPSLPREALVEAVTEMVAYTDRCTKTVERLRGLPPIPLDIEMIEFGL